MRDGSTREAAAAARAAKGVARHHLLFEGLVGMALRWGWVMFFQQVRTVKQNSVCVCVARGTSGDNWLDGGTRCQAREVKNGSRARR